jgi:arsenite/tail-anchored protein-transporting ATPase
VTARLVLFGGKGGVGRTTVAAATAAVAGARGARVLVVSADPAHSLADVLGVPLGPVPVAVGGFWAAEVDPRAEVERRWSGSGAALDEVLGDLAAEPVPAAELSLPAGVADLAALLAVRDLTAAGPPGGAGGWDAVLVDCAPTGQLLPLLALPEVLSGQLERWWPAHGRIVRAALGRTRAGGLPDAVERLQAALTSARELLSGASVRLVLTPEAVVVAETRRTLTALALHGYPVDSLVANRVLPAGEDSPWLAGWRAAQQAVLAGLRVDVPVRHAPHLPAEPVGPAALLALGQAVYGAADPLAPVPAPEPPAVVRSGSEYELRVVLPYVRRSDVRLTRAGDDLVLTVGGQRRRLALPSVLRRCVAVGASAGDGALRVRFRPDPALWPRDLAR